MNEESTNTIGGIAADALKQCIDRVERLEEEKKGITSGIKDVYAQSKSQGFDPKIVRKIVSLRKIERSEREEQDQLTELYMAALGMS